MTHFLNLPRKSQITAAVFRLCSRSSPHTSALDLLIVWREESRCFVSPEVAPHPAELPADKSVSPCDTEEHLTEDTLPFPTGPWRPVAPNQLASDPAGTARQPGGTQSTSSCRRRLIGRRLSGAEESRRAIHHRDVPLRPVSRVMESIISPCSNSLLWSERE